MNPVLSATLLVATLPCVAVAGQICVINGANTYLLFTIENTGGARARASLMPDEALCIDDGGATGGTVAAFESQSRLEGCSRLLGPSGQDTLLAYANFDRCRWQSHGD